MLDQRIETFLCVCRKMNYTKAAEELHITQPAISVQMKQLEAYYHVKLFEYHGRQLLLTKQGEMLKRAMQTMVHDEQYLSEQLHTIEAEHRKLHIGATKTIGEFVINEILCNFFAEQKKLELKVEVDNTNELLKMLTEGRLDFAFVEGYFPKEEYGYRVFSKERFICVSGKRELQKKKEYEMEELFKEELLVREIGSGSREILEKGLSERNYAVADFSCVHEINSLKIIKEILKTQRGISFLYEPAVREELAKGELFEVKLKDFVHTHQFTFVWRKDSIFEEEYLQIFQEFQRKNALNNTQHCL